MKAFFTFSMLLFAHIGLWAESPSLSCIELDRIDLKDGSTMVPIEFVAEGFPPSTEVKVITKRLDDSVTKLDLYIDENGDLLYEGRKYNMCFGLCGRGEPFHFTLQTKDQKYKASTKFVPFPLETMDDQGHYCSLTIMDRKGLHFALHLEGYKPDEAIEFLSISGGEKISQNIKLDSRGRLDCCVSPSVIGKSSGPATIIIKTDDGNKLSLKYTWGLPALKPVKS